MTSAQPPSQWNDGAMRPPTTSDGDAPTMPIPVTPPGSPVPPPQAPAGPWPPGPGGYAGAPVSQPGHQWAQPPMAVPDAGQPPQDWPGQPPVPQQMPYPASGPPVQQQWPVTYPTSGPPMQPMSGPPTSAPPTSGPPQSWPPAEPTSGPPIGHWRGGTPVSELPPWGDTGLPQDPPNAGPRIVPSPPEPRGKLLLGLLIGAVAGIVLAGPAGYFLHSPGETAAAPSPSAVASTAPTLSSYETVRRDVNKPKLGGDLAGLAEPWLPYLGGCLANGEPNGPALNEGEKTHVACTYGGISVHFATYESAIARDASRDYHVKLNGQAANLAPGLDTPVKKNGTVSKAAGMYIEYAYRLNSGVTICGLSWDRDDDTSGVTLEAVCSSELDGKWEPLREIWQRYS
ncbi:hypothetical protein ACQP00_05135 [Dactylosporangium sp. CS-047395]|uniref:hypothetical protein n=1 Tax=Dactylosporangium sp. CS-047395 TaxID=3239936 RepID=UPI003D8BA967